jgi:hypothetical protein
MTTRSDELAEDMDRILGMHKAVSIACPAFLSASDDESGAEGQSSPIRLILQAAARNLSIGRGRRKKPRIGLVLQAPNVKWHDIPESHFQEIMEAIGPDRSDLEVISVHASEFAELKKRRINMEIVYSFEASDYAKLLGAYDVVISTRLHGAIAAASLGVPSIVLNREDFRVNSAQAKLADILPLMRPAEALAFARSIAEPALAEWRLKIKSVRREALAIYKTLLEAHARLLCLVR